MLSWIALFIALLALNLKPSYAREALSCGDICFPAVATLENALSAPNATTCTNSNVQQYAACLDCDGLDSDQTGVDEYISSCAKAGFSVKNVTIAGAYSAFGSSGSNTQTNGGAGTGKSGARELSALLLGVLCATFLDVFSTFRPT
ncbi:hypothetical protein MVEN_01888000 [Mycena venus]|uniref:Uncharacterized protein n=1 Tax=Mycena venus TaxID=2733690 RepID=A0A8H6XHA8_9AGAR|nr:hypothetical protein MVEN_01888000 [Mycena venus]